jgi:hypothetical protein
MGFSRAVRVGRPSLGRALTAEFWAQCVTGDRSGASNLVQACADAANYRTAAAIHRVSGVGPPTVGRRDEERMTADSNRRRRALRILAAAAVTLLLVGPTALSGAEPERRPKPLTPEQVEKDQPKGEVTVRFRVNFVGSVSGGLRAGEPAYLPILLQSESFLENNGKFYVVLVGKALANVHRLGIHNPAEYFRGKTVEATGRVRYLKSPGEGRVEIPENAHTDYEMIIADPDHFAVAR